MLHKLKNEADFSLEKAVLTTHLDKFRRNGQYLSAVRCAEKLQDYQAVAEIAAKFGEIEAMDKIKEPFVIKSVEQGKKSKMKSVGQRARFGIPDDTNQENTIKFEKVKDAVVVQRPRNENINRINLGYDEAPFTYAT